MPTTDWSKNEPAATDWRVIHPNTGDGQGSPIGLLLVLTYADDSSIPLVTDWEGSQPSTTNWTPASV